MAAGQEVTDYRFFIRSIIRHSDLITKEASFDYLEKEGEKLLLEAMDELEVGQAFDNEYGMFYLLGSTCHCFPSRSNTSWLDLKSIFIFIKSYFHGLFSNY